MNDKVGEENEAVKNYSEVEPGRDAVSSDANGEAASVDTNTDGSADASIVASGKEKKGHGRVFALVAVLILVLAGCGVGAFFMLQKPEKKDTGGQRPEENNGGGGVELASYRLSGNDLSDFDLQFLRIEGKEENVVYSPLSIKYALAMLKDGAKGETKKQIEDLIGDYKAKKYTNGKNTSLANAMFIQEDFKAQVLDSYIAGLKQNYNAEVVYDSFRSPDTINGWISNKTLGLIKKVLSSEDIEGLNYALVNALAIDQNWNYQLQCNNAQLETVPCGKDWKSASYSPRYKHINYQQEIYMIMLSDSGKAMKFNGLSNRKAVEIGASFNNYDIVKELGEEKIREKVTEEYKKWLKTDAGKSAVSDYDSEPEGINPTNVAAIVDEYMKELKTNYGKESASTDFYVNDADDAKVFAKDLKTYNGSTLQYVGIMPKEKTLKAFLGELTADKTKGYIDNLKELKKENFKDGAITRIDAQIPLFEYDYKLSLKDDLQAMGVKDVFTSGKADLSNMTKTESYIAVAKHAATIDFSNAGIKAGAATTAGGLGGGGEYFDYLWDVPVEKIDLTFDKPFLYLIRDKDTGEVWFTGTVYKPSERIHLGD